MKGVFAFITTVFIMIGVILVAMAFSYLRAEYPMEFKTVGLIIFIVIASIPIFNVMMNGWDD